MFLSYRWSWALTIIWMGVIFFLSAQPAFEVADQAWLDNLAHIIAHAAVYAVLAGLVLNSLSFHRLKPVRLGLMTIITSFIYAVSDEWHQSFVPTRNPSLADLFWDLVGILLMVTILLRYKQRRLYAS